jgi:hypothetical protein
MTREEMLECTPPRWAALVREACEAYQSHDSPLRILRRPAAWAEIHQRLYDLRDHRQRTRMMEKTTDAAVESASDSDDWRWDRTNPPQKIAVV